MVDKVDDMNSTAREQERRLAAIPAREQIVDFYSDPIPVSQTLDSELYVPLRPLTDFLGLDFSAARAATAGPLAFAAQSLLSCLGGSESACNTVVVEVTLAAVHEKSNGREAPNAEVFVSVSKRRSYWIYPCGTSPTCLA